MAKTRKKRPGDWLLCPACNQEVFKLRFIDHLHLVCPVFIWRNLGGLYERYCVCGESMVGMIDKELIKHLDTPHDWPKLLTQRELENM